MLLPMVHYQLLQTQLLIAVQLNRKFQPLSISVPNAGVDSLSQSAKPNKIPKDSNAATAIKIPKKNKILGNSIFDKD